MKLKLIGMLIVSSFATMVVATTARIDSEPQTNSENEKALVAENIKGKAIANHPWNQGARASLVQNGVNIAIAITDAQGKFTFSASPGTYSINLLRHIGDTIYTGTGLVTVPADASKVRVNIHMACSFGC